MEEKKETSFKEERIRKLTQLYYSRLDIQKAIFNFSKNREVVPRYFEGFGKRPDSLQYPSDVLEMVKKGATSFHCSEEIWRDPLAVATGMSEKDLNNLREGWDLLIDIDSKYLDYSKILAEQIIKLLEFHGVKNIGVKFSGNKGWHIIIPWKAFPKEVNGISTKDKFPEWPRIIAKYLSEKTKPLLIEEISKMTTQSKYVKDFESPKEVLPDLVLVSPRHLFRMPYSLHEKTALSSVVIDKNKIKEFQPNDADPLKTQIKSFIPDFKEEEAKELLIQALDWYRETNPEEETKTYDKQTKYKPIKLVNLLDSQFPPSIQKILKGMQDGRKRALFVLINFFRSIGVEKDELEKRISEWDKKNEVPLGDRYIKPQLIWSFRNKIVPPPNYDKDYYKGIGIIPTPEEMQYKNPVNYMVKKYFKKLNNK